MNATPQIKGWCPGALRPMMSGDGLVVRVCPFGGRLTKTQANGLASLALKLGNGLLDLSSRGNMQLRGLNEANYPAVIEGLHSLGLIDPDVETEQRRNILVQPFWQKGDETQRLCTALERALVHENAPILPGKFGFAIDAGIVPVLQKASADIRIERAGDGGLILVADGSDFGKRVTNESAISQAFALAQWFVERRDNQNRMSALLQCETLPAGFDTPRQIETFEPRPQINDTGVLCAFELGQITATALESLAECGGLRMTPWRMVVIEGATDMPEIEGIITDPDDPILRIVACTGAPQCKQGLGATRPLARQIAVHLAPGQMLHVSGCAKGCAQPRITTPTVTAVENGLAFGAKARDADPKATLTRADIIQTLKAI